jgi:hypothetical protein
MVDVYVGTLIVVMVSKPEMVLVTILIPASVTVETVSVSVSVAVKPMIFKIVVVDVVRADMFITSDW